MKYAVASAAAAKGGGEGEAEAAVIREALAEYFTKRGVNLSEQSRPDDTISRLGSAAAKFNKTKKQQAARKKSSAA